MPRNCSICSNSAMMKTAASMIAAGATDQAIAAALGGGLNRMAVNRHRKNHVLAPAKALAEAAGKGRDAADQRAQVMAAAQAGDPAAFVALAGIVEDLRRVHERLERQADAAEHDDQRLAVASLSAQQLRAAEVRAKLGGIGGYGAQKAGADIAPFALTIQFSNGSRQTVTTISGIATDTTEGGGPVLGSEGIDAAVDDPDDGLGPLPAFFSAIGRRPVMP